MTLHVVHEYYCMEYHAIMIVKCIAVIAEYNIIQLLQLSQNINFGWFG